MKEAGRDHLQFMDMEKQGGKFSLTEPARKKGRRLILFPFPLQGHLNPMLQLANILYTQGFSITIIHTLFNSPNPSNYPHFTFMSFDDGLSARFPANDADLGSLGFLFSFLFKSCVKPFHDCLTGLLLDAAGDGSEEPIACLATDAIWHFTQAIADDLKLPRIVLCTNSISFFLVYSSFPFLLEKGYFHQDRQSDEPVSEFPALKIKDISIVTGNSKAIMSNFLSGMVTETKAASAIIWNTFKELEETALAAIPHEFTNPCFPIGPFHKYFPASSSSLLEPDRNFMSWLDLQAANSVIYINFGSVSHVSEDEFKEMAKGLAMSGQTFLWVVRPGLVCGSEWLESLPDGFLKEVNGRGHIIKWAPQQEVLAHPAIGYFWTHCGWNSTLESICEGVPMICSPLLGDQSINSRYITDVWKIGVYAEKGTEHREVERVIRRLMSDEGEEMRERIKCLKQKADRCLLHEQGGSSYEYLEGLVDYISSF